MNKTLALLLFSPGLLLIGCASYRPLPTNDEQIPFRDYVNDAMSKDSKTSYELRHVSTALQAFSKVTKKALSDRAARSWDNSDATTAGGIGAVIGGVADRTGLLNTGLVVAGLGLSGSTRYKLDQQVDLTLATSKKLNCISGRIGMVTPPVQQLIRTSGDQGAIDALSSAPEDAVRQIEQAQDAHISGLYAMKATVPTRAELVDYFGRFSGAQTAAGTAASAMRAASKSPEVEAAVKLIRTFSVELEACSKLGS